MRRAGAVLVLALTALCQPRPAGRAALDAFLAWKAAHAELKWEDALRAYRAKLRAGGLSEAAAEKTIRLVVAYDEAELYNRVYAGRPQFNTRPNQLLVDAVAGLRPGKALEVGMGQGRNALYLAGKGWDVTGFDVAEAGLARARAQAAALHLSLKAVLASDEEFEFGRDRWDLIAVIYAIEKHSVYRVREALKPGGRVVIEAGAAGAPFEYVSQELLKIFEGFRIVRYEETSGVHDWSTDRAKLSPLVRLVAQKPR